MGFQLMAPVSRRLFVAEVVISPRSFGLSTERKAEMAARTMAKKMA